MAPSPERVRIAQADWSGLPPEPWKNGAGVTRTLAVDTQPVPRWRVSIADIDRDGPYSRFPGHDRVSVVLSGQGVTLQGDGKEIRLLPGVPTAFAGDVAFQSRLQDGPVRVLNLFVLRGAAQAAVSGFGGGHPRRPSWSPARWRETPAGRRRSASPSRPATGRMRCNWTCAWPPRMPPDCSCPACRWHGGSPRILNPGVFA